MWSVLSRCSAFITARTATSVCSYTTGRHSVYSPLSLHVEPSRGFAASAVISTFTPLLVSNRSS